MSVEERLSLMESKIDRLIAEADLNRWMSDYCYLSDDHDWDAFGALFTSDAEWELPVIGTVSGMDKVLNLLRGMKDKVPFCLHRVANPRIDVDGDRASARWYYFCPLESKKIWFEGAGWLFGKYTGRFVQTSDGWRCNYWREDNDICAEYHAGWGEVRDLSQRRERN